jgi:hypothetical protein
MVDVSFQGAYFLRAQKPGLAGQAFLFVRAFTCRAMLMLDSRHGDDFLEVTSPDLFHLLGVSKSLTSH